MGALTWEVDRLKSFYDTHLKSFNAVQDVAAANIVESTENTGYPVKKEQPGFSSPVNLVSYQANFRAEALLLLRKGSNILDNRN